MKRKDKLMKIAVFPGSFDPITLGHLDIVNRGINLFDKIIIGVGTNSEKKYMFSIAKRIEFVEKTFLEEGFDSIIPISSKKNEGLDIVQDELEKLIPENDFFYPEEGFDFQSQTFEITETIREKVIRMLGDELPYLSLIHI